MATIRETREEGHGEAIAEREQEVVRDTREQKDAGEHRETHNRKGQTRGAERCTNILEKDTEGQGRTQKDATKCGRIQKST